MAVEPNSTSGGEDAKVLYSNDNFKQTVTNFILSKPLILSFAETRLNSKTHWEEREAQI